MRFSSSLDHVYGQIRCLRRRPRFNWLLDWSMDYSYQPVVVSHEHGSTEGSLLFRVNVEALRLHYHSYWQTNHWNIIGLRGVNES